jgi:hypothetical protein
VGAEADPQVAVPFEGGMRLTHALTIMSRSEYNRHFLAAEGTSRTATLRAVVGTRSAGPSCVQHAPAASPDPEPFTTGDAGCMPALLLLMRAAVARLDAAVEVSFLGDAKSSLVDAKELAG